MHYYIDMSRGTEHSETGAIVTYGLTLDKVFLFDFRLGQTRPTPLDPTFKSRYNSYIACFTKSGTV